MLQLLAKYVCLACESQVLKLGRKLKSRNQGANLEEIIHAEELRQQKQNHQCLKNRNDQART